MRERLLGNEWEWGTCVRMCEKGRERQAVCVKERERVCVRERGRQTERKEKEMTVCKFPVVIRNK